MTLLEAPSRVLPTDTGLPAPPTDTERDLYLSSQHRWLVPATAGTYLLVVVGIGGLVLAQPWSAFLLVPLALGTLSTVLSLLTSVQRSRVSLAGTRERVATGLLLARSTRRPLRTARPGTARPATSRAAGTPAS